ncbi:unnamed protein product [Boreogadus saida]
MARDHTAPLLEITQPHCTEISPLKDCTVCAFHLASVCKDLVPRRLRVLNATIWSCLSSVRCEVLYGPNMVHSIVLLLYGPNMVHSIVLLLYGPNIVHSIVLLLYGPNMVHSIVLLL